ncbi:MAG: beta-ketoacyl-[acyl-carrier-protein] synthase family protein [Bacteroidetes bacterium]|nr:beta-ketoacyl-[acyl-carrier-protein] synthase family protein [Bacteroidota bacterium]MBS1741205.1 beta-ketoacyl-[acyl-carrier-protein] synthase family protein [Bacteroidota bacterium]
MADHIVVTALGILSALGQGLPDHAQALQNNIHGLDHPQFLKTIHAPEFIMGEVKKSNDELATALHLPVGDNGYTRTTLLALTAMQQLLDQIETSLLQKETFAFINANTVGGMCSVEDMYFDFISEKKEGYFVKYIDTLDCAESTENVVRYFGLKPHVATISTACSSSANALILGARMIKHGLVERAICGGCDAMSRFTVNGFLSLKNVDKFPCKPFDQNRNGLNLGEGAGYLLLEKESDAKARGATILAYFSGYANSNDAYHPTAPSPDGEGAFRTMKQALDAAHIQANEISYINAHGTATANNDAAEGKAIQRLFGNTVPFSSTKPFTGHTLAAAGSIEAVFSILAMQQQIIFPNLNFETQMEELEISPVTCLQTNIPIHHVISNSFGFGGNNVSLIFSKG